MSIFSLANTPLYGQWLGLISIVLLIGLGIVSLFNPIFAILAFVFAFILIFVEIPVWMKCCPTSPRFDKFINFFQSSLLRAFLYAIMSVVMFLSTKVSLSFLVIPAITLALAALCYGLAVVTGQQHKSVGFLGGRRTTSNV